MKIYENIYIGKFIFQLGVATGIRKMYNLKTSVNLFQQNPADTILGDLVSAVKNKFILVEFKKDHSKDIKEINKAKKISDALSEIPNQDEQDKIKRISNSCHFLGVGEIDKNNYLKINFYKYLSYFLKPKERRGESLIDNFLLTYLDDKKTSIGVGGERFNQYVDFLKKNIETKRGGSTACILMSVNEKGETTAIAYESFSELIIELEKEFNNKKEKEIEIEDENNNDWDNGMDNFF